MLKRSFDIFCSVILLSILWPPMLIGMLLVFLGDFRSPFYVHERVGLYGKSFKMYKLRTMIVFADKCKIDTTKDGDSRITAVGRFLRKYKIDEIPQIFNVLIGDMSLVGPRPNVKREVDLYTNAEKKLLKVKPGITDFASIVFSNLGALLVGYDDANLAYSRLIRPWKSRLGILYVEHLSFWLDFRVLLITVVSIFSNKIGKGLLYNKILKKISNDSILLGIASGVKNIYPYHPPGASELEIAEKFSNNC
jgi:lipopolysaccharide/colanic/teichoic acid biosynthesis glycosyltransferase